MVVSLHLFAKVHRKVDCLRAPFRLIRIAAYILGDIAASRDDPRAGKIAPIPERISHVARVGEGGTYMKLLSDLSYLSHRIAGVLVPGR